MAPTPKNINVKSEKQSFFLAHLEKRICMTFATNCEIDTEIRGKTLRKWMSETKERKYSGEEKYTEW